MSESPSIPTLDEGFGLMNEGFFINSMFFYYFFPPRETWKWQ